MLDSARKNQARLIGIGLYTVPEASRYLGIPAQKIRRWLGGYSVVEAGVTRRIEPLWTTQIELGDDQLHLGFRDLIELRVVSAFIAEDFSPWRIRKALAAARELIGDERPLSTLRFQTDGRAIFLEVAREEGDPHLIDVLSRELAFQRILAPCLRDIEFESDVPVRWFIGGKGARVVMDPARSFGKPIDAETGVPVDALVGAFEVEGSVEGAARVFKVPIKAVQQALSFHGKMAA